jgi:hypothetical protein
MNNLNFLTITYFVVWSAVFIIGMVNLFFGGKKDLESKK